MNYWIWRPNASSTEDSVVPKYSGLERRAGEGWNGLPKNAGWLLGDGRTNERGKEKGPAGCCYRYILTSRNLDHEIRQAKEKEEEHPRAVIPEEGIPPPWYFLRDAPAVPPTSRYKSTGIAAVDIIPTASFKQSSFQEVLSHSTKSSADHPTKFELLFIGPTKWAFRSDSLVFCHQFSFQRPASFIYSGEKTNPRTHLIDDLAR